MQKKFIIVTDKRLDLADDPNTLVCTTAEFFKNQLPQGVRAKRVRVINLCQDFDYLSKGYYVSLLAEARGMQCVPSVADIVALNWKRNYEFCLPELNTLVEKHFHEAPKDPLQRTYTTYFGRHEDARFEHITRRVFDLFRFPAMSIELACGADSKWKVSKLACKPISELGERSMAEFKTQLTQFTGSAWRSPENKKTEKYWIAILHDPAEAMPPSDKAALNKFIKVGKKMNLWIELITKADYATLLEYDALLIRETTGINNHTFRFAQKAEQEGIPSIDDTKSIMRCCNKVFLHEILSNHQVPTPKTFIIDRKSLQQIDPAIEYPCVVKIPESSFSKGVFKVRDEAELLEYATRLLKNSEIILCQAFVPSAFDWRIGVLNGEVIFALKYYMAQGHWQIYNHAAKLKSKQSGAHESVPIAKVPPKVIEVALKASNLIGKGLYGVDLKETESGDVMVIEVNDNPNIDHNIEDQILGDALYARILEHLVTMIEA